MNTYDPQVFDEAFYRVPLDGRDRWRPRPHEYAWYPYLGEVYPNRTVQVVGCGRGWGVRFLRAADVSAYGFDISEFAIEHSVEPMLIGHHDLLVRYALPCGISLCVNVLCYLPEEVQDLAMTTMVESTVEAAILRVAVDEEQRAHPKAAALRKTNRPLAWWYDLWDKWWERDEEMMEKLQAAGWTNTYVGRKRNDGS